MIQVLLYLSTEKGRLQKAGAFRRHEQRVKQWPSRGDSAGQGGRRPLRTVGAYTCAASGLGSGSVMGSGVRVSRESITAWL